jgi:hypothetical protein
MDSPKQDAPPPVVVSLDGSQQDPRIGRARKWLVAISIIFLVSGFVFYAIQKDDAEKVIRESENNLAMLDAGQRDQAVMAEVGMTWDQWVSHTRNQVTMNLLLNIGLAVSFIGLFFYAKKNPLTATVMALLLYLSVIAYNAIEDPKTLPQGFIVKILFIGALAKAITAAKEERDRMPSAKLK